MEESIRKQLNALLRQEVVLATGCTEPGAVALCVSKAVETLGHEPEHIDLRLSKNVFKNAMGVGIPGTGMIGLPIAVSLAVVAGDSTSPWPWWQATPAVGSKYSPCPPSRWKKPSNGLPTTLRGLPSG